LSIGAARAEPIKTENIAENTFQLSGQPVLLNIYSDVPGNDDITINRIHLLTRTLEKFLESKGQNREACKQLNLDIFLIPYDALNDRDAMSFLNWSSWNNTNILGMYDSTYHNGERGSIYVAADQGSHIRDTITAHEIVHFWQDLTCYTSGNMEVLARDFETYISSSDSN
jgi:hypothetical protein